MMNPARDLAARLEGWLLLEDPLDTSKWNKRFCVLSHDDRKLYFHESRESQTSQPPISAADPGEDSVSYDGARQSRFAVERSARASLERPPLTESALSDTEEYRRATASSMLTPSGASESGSTIGGFSRLRASLRRGKSTKKGSAGAGDKDKKSGSFQRSKSLSRNEGRHYRRRLDESRPLGRSLDSLDSLSGLGEPNSSIDLAGKQPPTIRQLHQSISPKEHCFDIICGDATLRCGCSDEPQLKVWMEALNRCVNHERDNEAREEIDVTLWIMDSKGMPKKKCYYCEIFLDDTLYARTTAKVHLDSLFWGEHFSFSDVEVFNVITMRIFKDSEKKRKGPTLVGKVLIPVSQFDGKSGPVEKWYPIVGSHKVEQATIRIKTKYQVVPVLALNTYDNFLEYLQADYSVLCQVLEPIIPAKEKDEIAQMLIRIVNCCGKSHDFLMDIVMMEVRNLEDENLIFRGNTFATKAMDTYMKMIGEKYLKDTVGGFIRYLYDSDEECEVDPSRLSPEAELRKSQETLMLFVEKAWAKIVSSYPYFPVELQEVFHGFRTELGKDQDAVAKKLISGSIFLRFFCPAILSPSLFHLMQAYPDDKTSRKLTLVAKVLQSLANFTRFGAKEDYMFFMDEFLEREMPNMVHYIDKISSPLSEAMSVHTTPPNVDLGKELAIMHRILVEHISKLNKSDMARIGALPIILHSISNSAATNSGSPGRPRPSPVQGGLDEQPLSPSLTSPTNEGRHPSLLHSIRYSPSPRTVVTNKAVTSVANDHKTHIRRTSSPVFSSKFLHNAEQRTSSDSMPHIAIESGSDSSGSSGHGSPQRLVKRSLPHPPGGKQQSPILRAHSAKLALMRSSSAQQPALATGGGKKGDGVLPGGVRHSASSHVMKPASSQASLASKESWEDIESDYVHLREELSGTKAELRESRRALRSLRKELAAAREEIHNHKEKEVEMRKILERMVEDESKIRREKRELQEILSSKQHRISLQENRIRGLGVANARLLSGLEDLHQASPLSVVNGATPGTSAASTPMAIDLKEMKEKFLDEKGELSADLQDVIQRLQNPGAALQSPDALQKALRAERREKRRSKSNPITAEVTQMMQNMQSSGGITPTGPSRTRKPAASGRANMSPDLAAMIQELKNTGSEFV